MMKGLTIALALAALEGVYGHTIFTQLNGNRAYHDGSTLTSLT